MGPVFGVGFRSKWVSFLGFGMGVRRYGSGCWSFLVVFAEEIEKNWRARERRGERERNRERETKRESEMERERDEEIERNGERDEETEMKKMK